MKIITHKSFGAIKFGMSENEVIKQLGNPSYIDTSYRNELQYRYDEVIVRFDAANKLVREGTLFKAHKEDNGVQVNDFLINWEGNSYLSLCQADGKPYKIIEFIMLFNLGVGLAGFHNDTAISDRSISAFQKGDWWDEFEGNMTPFKF